MHELSHRIPGWILIRDWIRWEIYQIPIKIQWISNHFRPIKHGKPIKYLLTFFRIWCPLNIYGHCFNFLDMIAGRRKASQMEGGKLLGRRKGWQGLPADDPEVVWWIYVWGCRRQKIHPSRCSGCLPAKTSGFTCLGPNGHPCPVDIACLLIYNKYYWSFATCYENYKTNAVYLP